MEKLNIDLTNMNDEFLNKKLNKLAYEIVTVSNEIELRESQNLPVDELTKKFEKLSEENSAYDKEWARREEVSMTEEEKEEFEIAKKRIVFNLKNSDKI